MRTIEFKVSGMMCGACVSHVTRALQRVSGVQSASVDLASGTARVAGENLDQDALVTAVEEDGYDVQGFEGTAHPPDHLIPLIANGCSCWG